GGEEDYDASLSMSVDITNADDAYTDDDPFTPQYNVTVEASEGSDISAAEYLRQEMERFDRLVVAGLDHSAGALEYSLDEDVDTLLADGLTNVGGNSVTFQAVNRYGDWSIDDAGGYSLTAGLVDDDADTQFDNLTSRPETFSVEGPDEPDTAEGWTVSIATEPDQDEDGNPLMQAQDLSESGSVTEYVANAVGIGADRVDNLFGALNSTAEPGFNIYVHSDEDGADAEQYLDEDLDSLVVKWMETEHRFEGDAVPTDTHYDPSGTVQKMAVLDSYDPATGTLRGEIYDGGDTTGVPVDTVDVDVDIQDDGLVRLEEPLPYEIPDGGAWDVGAELHHNGELAGREWGGFDIDRYSRGDALRDFVTAFSYANHAGQMPEEEDEDAAAVGERLAEYREQHGGITGAIDDFFEMSPSHISDEMVSRLLGTIPPFNMIPGVREN
ncbi:MAG: hypothetical protein ABEI97_00070, partial [Candidatus Nanohaloarchaea archaeon]